MNEPLNEQDLDWLARAHNRLVRMRKREAANKNHRDRELSEAIEAIGELHKILEGRFK